MATRDDLDVAFGVSSGLTTTYAASMVISRVKDCSAVLAPGTELKMCWRGSSL